MANSNDKIGELSKFWIVKKLSKTIMTNIDQSQRNNNKRLKNSLVIMGGVVGCQSRLAK